MKNFVKFIVIFLLGFSFENAKAQTDWIDFGNGGESGQNPEIDMYSSTDFNVDFYGVERHNKTENEVTYDVLLLPGNYGKTRDIGFPQLPVLTYYIEITADTPVITINSKDYNLLENFNLLPAQESETISEWDSIPPFEKNDSVYNLNSFYPAKNIKASLPLICRGHKIAIITVYPIQFNPVSKQLKVLKNIDFKVHGAGSTEFNNDNIIFENLLESNVINYVPNTTPDYNIDLLILTPDEYYDALEPLKLWKEKTGVRTRIVTRSELESTPPFGYNWIADPEDDGVYEGIDKYIKNAYDNWGSYAPEFILLIGEPDLLPTHYWYSTGTNIPIASDMYYATMDLGNLPPGVDWIFDFPDIFVGRISVDNNSELNIIINKIIKYESNPYLSDTNIYNKILIASTFEGFKNWGGYSPCWECDDTTDCKFYIQTSESISDYLMNNNYILTKIYCSNVDYPKCYKNGDHLPDGIQFYGDWDGPSVEQATSDVIQSINNGVLLINHRDHGNSKNKNENYDDGWGSPELTQDHLSLIYNVFFHPPMFSINCRTAWFDGGTDFPPNGNGINYDCLGELLLSDTAGVVGFIGSTRASISGYNDELNKGLFDAIWADFDPFFGSSIQTPTFNLGPILNHGLLFMYNKYILTNGINYDITLTPERARRSFEQYHVLGDPTLEMWTGVPQPLYAYVDFEENKVTVYDENDQVIPDAKVVLQYGEEYQLKMTNINGQVYSSLLNNYDVEVSALKHNYIPWYSTVISENTTWASDVDLRGNIIIVNGGNLTFSDDVNIPKYSRIIVMEGGTLTANENVNISFSNSYNDILSFGNLAFGQNTSFSMSGPGQGSIKLLN